jgi:hypothetical protein
MPNDKEKVIREMHKELATLAQESIERDKQLAKLEAEVIAMRDAMPRWISVDDRLPKDKGYMLVFDDDTEYYNLAMFADDIGWTEIGTHIRLKEVDYWMPLPEPPTGGEQIPFVAIGNDEPVPEQLKHLFVQGEKRDVDEFDASE